MRIKAMHPSFRMPTRGTESSGAFDIFMPTGGSIFTGETTKVGLGFATEVPHGHVALVLPRSGVGSKSGVELNNTCGVIDTDYRGEWFATLRTKTGQAYSWSQHERLLQFLIVPVWTPKLVLVSDLNNTTRGAGGLGSTGN